MMTVNNLRLHADFTFSLVVVVIIFLVCQLANPVRRVLVAVSTSFQDDDSVLQQLYEDDDNNNNTYSTNHHQKQQQLDSHVTDLRVQAAHERCGAFYFYYAPVVVLAVDLNSAVNFFVYVSCGRRFRAKVLRLVRCGRPANAVQPIAVLPR